MGAEFDKGCASHAASSCFLSPGPKKSGCLGPRRDLFWKTRDTFFGVLIIP